MRLSELAEYAKNKYGIREEHKWADFPGFSVLTDPFSGKWAALLMQKWDQETGEITEHCDIKCGRQTLSEYVSYGIVPHARAEMDRCPDG